LAVRLSAPTIAVVFGWVMVRFRLFASDMYIKDPQGQFVLKKES
jgi:hypothetical protein